MEPTKEHYAIAEAFKKYILSKFRGNFFGNVQINFAGDPERSNIKETECKRIKKNKEEYFIG